MSLIPEVELIREQKQEIKNLKLALQAVGVVADEAINDLALGKGSRVQIHLNRIRMCAELGK